MEIEDLDQESIQNLKTQSELLMARYVEYLGPNTFRKIMEDFLDRSFPHVCINTRAFQMLMLTHRYDQQIPLDLFNSSLIQT